MIEWYWVIAIMVFAHIIEDFHIQGILAKMKQRDWWYDQYAEVSHKHPDADMSDIMDKYGSDFQVALIVHGFEWAFIVGIPLMLMYGLTLGGFCAMMLMASIHCMIDDQKCNAFRINLIIDQALHLVQIIIYYLMWVML